jgi:hypothetical protein
MVAGLDEAGQFLLGNIKRYLLRESSQGSYHLQYRAMTLALGGLESQWCCFPRDSEFPGCFNLWSFSAELIMFHIRE